jgi:hypothetical protein
MNLLILLILEETAEYALMGRSYNQMRWKKLDFKVIFTSLCRTRLMTWGIEPRATKTGISNETVHRR